jgi:hypothetical protein
MQQDIGFDIISDLNLNPNDSFNWENKASSLYCILAGNISSNIRTVAQVLVHLSKHYQGVFYVPGDLEYETTDSIPNRTNELMMLCESIPSICMLHQHVAIIDGIAIMGVNGWANQNSDNPMEDIIKTAAKLEDLAYLKMTVQKLQRHLDVKKIIVVTSAVPRTDLFYGEEPSETYDQIPLSAMLTSDTERKVKHWVFGTYVKNVDTILDDVNYLNNPFIAKSPYWAKRLTVNI